jgi:hypothetical protein
MNGADPRRAAGRKPNVFRFADDGVIPNNPQLPFIFYGSPVRVVGAVDPAALFEVLFARNGKTKLAHLRITDSARKMEKPAVVGRESTDRDLQAAVGTLRISHSG